MICDIAFINGVSVAREDDDPEAWRVQIDTEELGTHSTVLLRLSLLNAAILMNALDSAVRTTEVQTDRSRKGQLWSHIYRWWEKHRRRQKPQ